MAASRRARREIFTHSCDVTVLGSGGAALTIRASCLRQSLLVWWFLRRRGLGAKLRIGVNNREEFLANGWVELEGRDR